MTNLTSEQEQAQEEIEKFLASFSKDDRAKILYDCWLDAFHDSIAIEETIDPEHTKTVLLKHIDEHLRFMDGNTNEYQNHVNTHSEMIGDDRGVLT